MSAWHAGVFVGVWTVLVATTAGTAGYCLGAWVLGPHPQLLWRRWRETIGQRDEARRLLAEVGAQRLTLSRELAPVLLRVEQRLDVLHRWGREDGCEDLDEIESAMQAVTDARLLVEGDHGR